MPPVQTTDSGTYRPYTKLAGSEPLPGYKLLSPLGRGGFGEVWKCEAPGGLHKAIKFVTSESGERHFQARLPGGAPAGYRYNEPAFGVTWPLPVTIISDNDRRWPDFRAETAFAPAP